MAARPDIDVRTEQMVSNGRWMPKGYHVRICTLSPIKPILCMSVARLGANCGPGKIREFVGGVIS